MRYAQEFRIQNILSIIATEGMNILVEKLGMADAERFISIMLREPFNYTKWHQTFMQGKSVKEIIKMAMDYANSNKE